MDDNIKPSAYERYEEDRDFISEGLDQIIQFINTVKLKRAFMGGLNRKFVWALIHEVNNRYQELYSRQRAVMENSVRALKRQVDDILEENRYLYEKNRRLLDWEKSSDAALSAKPAQVQYHYYFPAPAAAETDGQRCAAPAQPVARQPYKLVEPIPPREGQE